MAPQEFAPWFYKVMGYEAAPWDHLSAAGLPPSYVAEETRRAAEQVAGDVAIYPGIDINVPVLGKDAQPGGKTTTPGGRQPGRFTAFGAGASGIVLSREYLEMWLRNLTAAGDTLREVFAANR